MLQSAQIEDAIGRQALKNEIKIKAASIIYHYAFVSFASNVSHAKKIQLFPSVCMLATNKAANPDPSCIERLRNLFPSRSREIRYPYASSARLSKAAVSKNWYLSFSRQVGKTSLLISFWWPECSAASLAPVMNLRMHSQSG